MHKEQHLNYINNSLYFGAKICSDICPRTLSVPRSEQISESFEEQITSKDKYLSILLKSNGGYCVYYSSNIFRNMRESQYLPFCHMSITSKFVSCLPKSFNIQISLQSKAFVWGKCKKFKGKENFFNSVKEKMQDTSGG